jgi:TonB family protein
VEVRHNKIQSLSARLAQEMILVLSLALAVSGQETAMRVAATQLADAIVHSKQKAVVVLDFSGPDKKVTVLGEKLADDLSAALANSEGGIRVTERSQVEEKRKEEYYDRGIVLDPVTTLLFARDLKAKSFVMGQISFAENDKILSVVLNTYRTDNGKGIKALKVTFPLSKEIAELAAKNLTTDLSSYPNAGAAGYSLPACVYCPRADYSGEAMNEKVQGVVKLIVVVTAEGRVTGISVVKGLPAGLTLKAIEAVRKWRLSPAIGPDGKPTAVRQIIEVAFQYF